LRRAPGEHPARQPRGRGGQDGRRDELRSEARLQVLSRPRALRRARAASITSLAVIPTGPDPEATSASAAAPCSQVPATRAERRSPPAGRSAARTPASAPPTPAAAFRGFPEGLTQNRPRGSAITLPFPLGSAPARWRFAIALAAATRPAWTARVVPPRRRAA